MPRKDGALFGPAKYVTPHASLKRLSLKSIEDKEDYRETYAMKIKDPLPNKNEAPVVGMKSNKNFITANAVEAILQGMYS